MNYLLSRLWVSPLLERVSVCNYPVSSLTRVRGLRSVPEDVPLDEDTVTSGHSSVDPETGLEVQILMSVRT